jgi:hypothetical protein
LKDKLYSPEIMSGSNHFLSCCRYLKERLEQAEEEKEMSNQALSKYKVSLAIALNGEPYKHRNKL